MKLLTLNTHSLVDGNGQKQISSLAAFLAEEHPHIIALQEVDQTASAPLATEKELSHAIFSVGEGKNVPIKSDNFALGLTKELSTMGEEYFFCWLPVKLGYGIFDEGLAILSREKIEQPKGFYISRCQDYTNWKTRMALTAELPQYGVTVCNLHTSRFDDADEPFSEQWQRLKDKLPIGRILLTGDLNNSANARGEGYDTVISHGFYDLYELANEKAGYNTVIGNIDGWEDNDKNIGQRIDFVFSSFEINGKDIVYRTVLDGRDGAVVSDHFGIMIEIKGDVL